MELPAGYTPMDDPGAVPLGLPVRDPSGEPRLLFQGAPAAAMGMASVRALQWSRVGHPALVPVVAHGLSGDTSWYTTPYVEALDAPTLDEVVVLLQGLCALQGAGLRHGDVRRASVRHDGGVGLLPPWPDAMALEGADRRAIAEALWRAVAEGEPALDGPSLVLRVEAPTCVAGTIAMLARAEGLAVDALLALVEAGATSPAGTRLPLTPIAPAMALPAPEPPEAPAAPASGDPRLRAREEVPLVDPEVRRALWAVVREVASSGRPQGVVLRGRPSTLVGITDWLRATLAREALAESLSLRGGRPVDLARALHPGGAATVAAFDAAWKRTHPDASDEEVRGARRWCGPLAADEVRAPHAVGRRLLQAHIDRGCARGLFALTLDEVTDEGVALAGDLLRGDRPVVVVLALDEASPIDASGLDARVVEVSGLDTGAAEVWLKGLGLEGDIAARVQEADGDAHRLRAWAQHATDGGRPLAAADASDVMESLTRVVGAERRVRDALHLASLAALPVPVAHGFLGPVEGLWDATALAGARGGVVRVDPALAADARRRADVRYLHRRLSRAWGRSALPGAAERAGAHALEANDGAFARERFLEAGTEAAAARDGATLLRLAEAVDGVLESVDDRLRWARWRAEALEWTEADAGEAWEAVLDLAKKAGPGAAVARAQVGRARALAAHGDAGAYDALQTALDAARDEGDVVAEALCLYGQGELLVAKKRTAFQQKFDQAIHRLGQVEAPWLTARVLDAQADIGARTGSLQLACELYTEAEEAWLESDEGPSAVRSCIGRARALVHMDKLDDALHTADRAQALARAWLDPEGVVLAVLMRAEVQRHAGGATAGSLYERAGRDAAALGLASVRVEAWLGQSLLAMARGDAHAAYEATSAASKVLDGLPGHPLWARYRLTVATQLAQRSDHMQTWQWLYSANEIGLEDAHRDVAAMATSLSEVGRTEGWGNVVRLAGDIAVRQLKRLGNEGDADRLRSDITGFIRQ